MPNHIHSDSKKRRSFLALLFAAGDVRRKYDNQTVEMKRVTTDNNIPDALNWAAIYTEMSASEKNICFWKKIPRFLVAVNRLTAEWDRQRATLADAALRNKGVASTLRKILMNDQFYADKSCGSPKAFFESYLR